MKNPKTAKTLALGFVLGAACMVTTSAIGGSRTVSAIINDNLFFNINGEFIKSTDENPILNYNSRVYVPVRFVSEKLDCDVKWDDVTKTVTIRGAEPKTEIKEVEKIVEKEVIVYVDDSESDGKLVYKKLPANYKNSDFEINVLGVKCDDINSCSKVMLDVLNRGDNNIQLMQSDCVLIADGKEYKMNSYISGWDDTWDNDIRPGRDEDDAVEGFLYFDYVDKDWSTMSLKLKFRVSDGNGKYSYENVQINFKK